VLETAGLEMPGLEMPGLEMPGLEMPVLEMPVLETTVLETPVLETTVPAEIPRVPPQNGAAARLVRCVPAITGCSPPGRSSRTRAAGCSVSLRTGSSLS
jgi:hypothetical protein